jgi:hypothetical protein
MISGDKVDYSSIQRWVFKYRPMIEASMHKIKNRFLYRAVDKYCDTVNQNPRIIYIDSTSSTIRAVNRNNSGIKTSKLGSANTLIIVLNKTTEISSVGLQLILGLKSLNQSRGLITHLS